jgi:hypothetical protein
MKYDYQVGYRRPPKAHQFKPKHLREHKAGGQRKETCPDIAALIDKPQKVRRGGKTISMHPLEAEVTSLGIRALNGEARAAKSFLKHCDFVGLLDSLPTEQTHGVFLVTKDMNSGIVGVLLQHYGMPPWDRDVYAALEAEYRRDQENIEGLYVQFMKDLENE